MRGVLAPAIVATAVVLAPASLAAGHVPRAIATQMTARGEITALGPARIAIGRVGCAVPARLASSAGKFVITDSVKITCRNGTLRSIRYSPELATAQTTRPGGGDAATTVPTRPAGGTPASVGSAVYTIGVLFLGGTPPGDTTTVTGTIDDVSTTTVTVAGVSCAFKVLPTSAYFSGPQVGDKVTLTCTGGQLIRLASVGAVSR